MHIGTGAVEPYFDEYFLNGWAAKELSENQAKIESYDKILYSYRVISGAGIA